eukprot:PhF_6_TR35428/c0_g1_i6/m.51617
MAMKSASHPSNGFNVLKFCLTTAWRREWFMIVSRRMEEMLSSVAVGQCFVGTRNVSCPKWLHNVQDACYDHRSLLSVNILCSSGCPFWGLWGSTFGPQSNTMRSMGLKHATQVGLLNVSKNGNVLVDAQFDEGNLIEVLML